MPTPRTTYRAIWNGAVLAESDRNVEVEGNQYFPADSINRAYFRPCAHTSVCSWKGTANYFSFEVDGRTNPDAAWYYSTPSPAAAGSGGHVAFWKGVRVVEVERSAPAGQETGERN